MVKFSTMCVDVMCRGGFALFFTLYVPVHTVSDRFELVLGHLCANTPPLALRCCTGLQCLICHLWPQFCHGHLCHN